MFRFRTAAAIAVAGVAAAVLAACAPAGAPAESATPAASEAAPPPPIASSAAAPEAPALSAEEEAAATAYVARFGDDRAAGGAEWLDAAGVDAEFREAADVFPFALPDGFEWPSASSIATDASVGGWEHGSGVTEAYSYWHGATATAAAADLIRGQEEAGHAHLEALAAGYASPVRSMSLDPEQPGTDSGYYRGVLVPALEDHDLSILASSDIPTFLDVPAHADAARAAGDFVDFGTEGWSMPATP